MPEAPPTMSARDAVTEARGVVGLYGDPRVSWSIVLEAYLDAPVSATSVDARLAQLVAGAPHLGAAPRTEVVDDADWAVRRELLANDLYDDHGPLLRVTLHESGRRIVVAGHHGCLDGLGLLVVLATALGTEVGSTARGVGDAEASVSFLARAVGRLWEAATRPPRRFARVHVDTTADGDWLMSRPLQVARVDTASTVAAARAALVDWNTRQRRSARPPVVVAVGASRRDPAVPLTADRCTGYLRLPDVGVLDADSARALLRRTAPEPEFPAGESTGRVGPWATRVLASRMGSSVLVSNLSALTFADGVERVDFYPCPSGPAGVAVGLATAGSQTVMTLRVRREAFSRRAAEELADVVAEALVAQCADGAAPTTARQ